MNNEPFDTLYPPPVFTFRLFRLGDNYSDTGGRVEANRLHGLPDCYKIKLRGAGYRLVYQVQEKWIKLAFEIDTVVDASVAEHSINPQNIEAGIRKQLLPRMFQECKAIGSGMEQAKKIVEMVVQITRVGLSGV